MELKETTRSDSFGNIALERVTATSHPLYAKALELFRMSFPWHEQREESSLARILEDEAYHFDLIRDGDIFAGIFLYWEMKEYYYLEHLCIWPELRNHQYGKKALEIVKNFPKPLILEIDPPVDEISIRRKGFYERNGFAENPYEYYQLPYHRGDGECPLVLMTYPEVITQERYDTFLTDLRNRIMNRNFE